MNMQIISKRTKTGFWPKFRAWMDAVDEAVHYDSAEALHRQIADLNRRLDNSKASKK